MKKIIILLILFIVSGNTVTADEQISSIAGNNDIEVNETVDIGFSWSIPSELNFVDGKAELIVEIKEVHIRPDTELNIKLLDYDDNLKTTDGKEKLGSPICIKDEYDNLIEKGSTVLSGRSYQGNDENVNSDLSKKLYVFINRPKFLIPGEFKGNITFSAAVKAIGAGS